jgi:hypothetical protein
MMRTIKVLMLCVSALGTFSQSVKGQAPPAGPCAQTVINGNWNFRANGSNGTLTILTDGSGNILPLNSRIAFPNGSFDTIRGYWAADSCKLTFVRSHGADTLVNPSSVQVYAGFVFPFLDTSPGGSKLIAGSFRTFGGSTPDRNEFGWYALK